MTGSTARCVAVAMLAATPAAAQHGLAIELSRVPAELSYPVEAGSNPLVTAVVHGGDAEEVWLAISARAVERVPLTEAGPGRWQVNLASSAVCDLLARAGQRGEFAIHARGAAGQHASSAAIRYTFLQDFSALPTLCVYAPDAFWSGLARPGVEAWLDSRSASRIEWYFARADATGLVEAVAGGMRWPLQIDAKARRATLIVTDEVRERWEEHGALALHADGRPSAVLRARPARLQIEPGGGDVSVTQRRSAAVPGSRGWLEVFLDDITGGQVRIGIRTADRTTLVAPRSLLEGERLPFALGAHQYAIRVKRLVNVLIGDDFAELAVETERPNSAEAEVERLLALVENAKITFVREGERHTGAEAAAHLRRKYAVARARIASVDEFIEQIASRSSTTGNEYQVELEDGALQPAGAWLRAQRAR